MDNCLSPSKPMALPLLLLLSAGICGLDNDCTLPNDLVTHLLTLNRDLPYCISCAQSFSASQLCKILMRHSFCPFLWCICCYCRPALEGKQWQQHVSAVLMCVFSFTAIEVILFVCDPCSSKGNSSFFPLKIAFLPMSISRLTACFLLGIVWD